MEKICVIGCTDRGIVHANSYRNTADVIGVCDFNSGYVDIAKAKIFPTPIGYSDADTMLTECEPSIIHIITSPKIPRYTWMPLIERHPSVKVLVMEKPLVLTPAQLLTFKQVYDPMKLAVIINHQRQYFHAFRTLRFLLEQNWLGEIYTVNLTAYGEVMEMMTHLLDIVLMIRPKMPDDIVAKAWGDKLIDDPLYLCPDNIVATLIYSDYPMINVTCGIDEMFTDSDVGVRLERLYRDACHYNNRARVVVAGSRGMFFWHEYGEWGYQTEQGYFNTKSDYCYDTEYAQFLLTQDCLQISRGEMTADQHLCHVDRAVKGMELLFSIYNACSVGENLGSCVPIDNEGYVKMLHKIKEILWT